jgi:hypothetical protein
MIAILLLSLLVASSAMADPFADIEAAHNAGAPMSSIMTPVLAEEWDGLFAEGRGTAVIDDARWSASRPGFGVARWSWHRGDESECGWLALQVDRSGLVSHWAYTEKAPPKVRLGAVAGQSADVATTALGLVAGATEINPIVAFAGLPVIGPIKIGGAHLLQHNASLSTCVEATPAVDAIGWSAAIVNACVLAGAGPASIPAGGIILAVRLNKAKPVWQCLPSDLHRSR